MSYGAFDQEGVAPLRVELVQQVTRFISSAYWTPTITSGYPSLLRSIIPLAVFLVVSYRSSTDIKPLSVEIRMVDRPLRRALREDQSACGPDGRAWGWY